VPLPCHSVSSCCSSFAVLRAGRRIPTSPRIRCGRRRCRSASCEQLYSANLTTAIAGAATSIPVSTTAGLRFPTAIVLDPTSNREIVKVCAKTTAALVVCAGGRGFDNTGAVAHAKGEAVSSAPVAYAINQLAAEVKALAAAVARGFLVDPTQLRATGLPTGTYCVTVVNERATGLVPCSGPAGLSWSGLNSPQWASLSSGQWAGLSN